MSVHYIIVTSRCCMLVEHKAWFTIRHIYQSNWAVKSRSTTLDPKYWNKYFSFLKRYISILSKIFRIFKGTVSRDKFGFWWNVWLVLGLNRGLGQYKLFRKSKDCATPKVYFPRLMQVYVVFYNFWKLAQIFLFSTSKLK